MPVQEALHTTREAIATHTLFAPRIVVGITDSQTCLNLTGRLRALREAGFHVTLISSPGEEMNSIVAREGAEPIALRMKRNIAPLADIISLLRIVRLMRRLRPDIVEFSSPKAGLLGSLAAWFAGVPVRIYMLRGLKFQGATGIKRSMLIAAERVAAACAQIVLCNSHSMRAEAIAAQIAPAAKLHLLGAGSSNGVDVERFLPGLSDVRDRLGLPPSVPVIGFVGRLTRDKGIPELLDAFDLILASVPDSHLLLVGWYDRAEDALSADLKTRIESHPRIHFTGYVADTAPWYRVMDLLVLPTWREGFPNVVLEAGASGLPVVTTLATGSRDSVIPEVTGVLIPPGYPEAIAEAVLSLLNDTERCHKMGRAARAWIIENYSNARVLGLTVDYYKSLLRNHSNPGR